MLPAAGSSTESFGSFALTCSQPSTRFGGRALAGWSAWPDLRQPGHALVDTLLAASRRSPGTGQPPVSCARGCVPSRDPSTPRISSTSSWRSGCRTRADHLAGGLPCPYRPQRLAECGAAPSAPPPPRNGGPRPNDTSPLGRPSSGDVVRPVEVTVLRPSSRSLLRGWSTRDNAASQRGKTGGQDWSSAASRLRS